ncbi:hypothetical protein Tco_1108003 [Tanacetum coccineum]
MNLFTISSIVNFFLGQGNWNGLSKVPVMKYMIQSKAVLNFKSAEMIRPASDTPYCVSSGYAGSGIDHYAFSCDELARIRRIFFAGYDV